MNRFLAFALIPVIVVLPGCGALALQRQNDQLGEVVDGLNKLRQEESKAREQADANHDGKLTGTELLTYGGLLATAAGTAMAQKKSKDKHKESAEHRDDLDKKVNDLMRAEDIRVALQRAKDHAS